MKKRIPAAMTMLILVAVPVLMASSLVLADSGEENLKAAGTVFEETCSKCHSPSRALGKKKDQAGWESTVSRMAAYHKRRFDQAITEEDQKTIVQFLLKEAGK